MFTVMDIVQPATVEEAYSILTKRKNNQVIGGSAWLRMGSKRRGRIYRNRCYDYIQKLRN